MERKMSSIKHRVGIIGLNHWYLAYPIMGYLIRREDIALDWICSKDEQQLKQTADIYRVKKCTASYQEVLDDPAVDIVLVTTTTDLHDEVVIAAAKAGKHILLGKPISKSLKGADKIIQAVKDSGVKAVGIAAGPDPGDPVYKLIKQSIIGKPYAAASSFRARIPLKQPGVLEPGWFKEIDRAAGGAFVDHAIYAATRLALFFDSSVKTVYAQMDKMAHKDWEVEDYGVAMIRYQNGAIATIESTIGAMQNSISHLSVTGTEGEIWSDDNEIRIVGSKPEYKTPVVYKKQSTNWIFNTVPDYYDPLAPLRSKSNDRSATFFDELLNAIDNGYQTLNTVENARKGLEICLAAYKSADIGLPVELPLKEDVDVKEILSRLR